VGVTNPKAMAVAAAICVVAAPMAACSGSSETETQGAAGAQGGLGGSGASGGSGGDSVGGGLGTGGGGGAQSGCNKVDFLFVVDNSISMQDQQQALITSFPGFIGAIQATASADSDYHIMVADTDEWGRCDTANGWSGHDPNHSSCNAYIEATTFEECDRTLGAGVVHPAGEHASNQACAIFGDNRYIVEGEPDLAATFDCVARVGVAGHPSERPMDAMVATVSAALNGPGGCNEGFLRDDAILVVTFISDDPNYEDAGTPQDWYDAVVAAKGGNAEAVVVLGLTPNFMGCQNGAGPPKGAHWSEFIALWGDRGLEASVCDSDYAPFFADAVAVVDETCDEFEPPS
jgi:hypothetical protein